MKSIYKFKNNTEAMQFCGPLEQTIKQISYELNMEIIHVNDELLTLDDADPTLLLTYIETINSLTSQNVNLQSKDLMHILMHFKRSKNYEQTKEEIVDFYLHKPLILNCHDGKKIYAKTLTQKAFTDLISKSSIMFVTGSAGTGKTYLAVAYAVSELKKNNIKKIIITRPAVEAGEKLGFLPGDLKEKVDPYLVPIYDALNEFLGKENALHLLEKGVIEVAPLAYMRGRTLDHAIIILDEAQNTTSTQMKMFITRLGYDSKMIITGDTSQTDLERSNKSGLVEATELLKGIPGISHLEYSKYDVMRHPLVIKILERYGDVE